MHIRNNCLTSVSVCVYVVTRMRSARSGSHLGHRGAVLQHWLHQT